MSSKPNFLTAWQSIAGQLFEQALAGAPKLLDTLPRPANGNMAAFTATIEGDMAGTFTLQIEESVFDSPLLGEGIDQRATWGDLLRECVDATLGNIEHETGLVSKVVSFAEQPPEGRVTLALELKGESGGWLLLLTDKVKVVKVEQPVAEAPAAQPAAHQEPPKAAAQDGDLRGAASQAARYAALSELPLRAEGVELLLDVELEASLRFGTRELPLGEILNLGPGDVVELDRQVADPVDLVVGDRIVARGEVVLVNGNFGLRVTEVAEPRKRLETIRCLF